MYKLIVASIFIAITLSEIVPAYADMLLSGKEIKKVISENTAVGERRKSATDKEYISKSVAFQTYFGANGQLVEKGSAVGASMGSPVSAHGSWKVKNEKLCYTFSDSLRNVGKQMCRKVVRKDDGAYELIKKGKVKRVWKKILPGNPYNLK